MGAGKFTTYPEKLSLDEFKQIVWEDHEDFELVEDGDWISDGKYDHCSQVVKHLPSGKHYTYTLGRSGSYYSDYYYDYEDTVPDMLEVKQVTKTVTVTEWEAV